MAWAFYDNTGATKEAVSGVSGDAARMSISTTAFESFTHNGWNDVDFETIDYDYGNIALITGSVSKMTIVTPGIYTIAAGFGWEPNQTGDRSCAIVVNGSPIASSSQTTVSTSGAYPYTQVSTDYELAAGNVVQVLAYQNSGVTLDLAVNADNSDISDPFFTIALKDTAIIGGGGGSGDATTTETERFTYFHGR